MLDETKMRCIACGSTEDDVSLINKNEIYCHDCGDATSWLCECGYSNDSVEAICEQCNLRDPQE